MLTTFDEMVEQDEPEAEVELSERVSGIRFVRAETTLNPGLVIWHEIQACGVRE